MTEDEWPEDEVIPDAEMMKAFRALPFENRVLPGEIITINGKKIYHTGEPVMALDAWDHDGNPATYKGTPIRVVRVDGDKYPIRLTIRLITPEEFAGTRCDVLFKDANGEDPAMLIHDKFHIFLRHD